MPDIKSIIAQSKQKKFLGEGDTVIRAFIDAKVQDLVSQAIEEITPKLYKEVSEEIEEEIKRLTKDVKKGDKGDTPKVGIDFEQPKDGEPGKPGKDYVLTNKDKVEIASKIKVPVVEKITEKVEVRQPIVTEVAKYETAEQIAGKLNTLEDKIDIKVIKGLKNLLENLKRGLREKSGGGGGGMGNVVHEQFTGDGVTTSYTLASNIAGNGNAVIGCRYEGQVQFLGDQFTISGRTLTMTFTPVEGTKIEITYIRA